MRITWNPGPITTEVEAAAMDRLEEIANRIAARAKAFCPVGTISRPRKAGGKEWTERVPGTLRNSIRVTRLKGDPKLDVRVYAGNRDNAYYAPFVERGTVKMKAKPFLRPAAAGAKSAAAGLLENL
jgi:HK97 gp10 family phage protein